MQSEHETEERGGGSLERLVGPLGADGKTAQARISIEHGWLCIRNDSGWLLWSAKETGIPRDGLLLAGVLEHAAANHESWLKDRESAERPNAKLTDAGPVTPDVS